MSNQDILFIDGYDTLCDYKPSGGGRTKKGPPLRDRKQHGALVLSQWRAIWAERARLRAQSELGSGGVANCKGCYIDFKGTPGYDLKVKSLESRSKGIALSNITVTKNEDGLKRTCATVFLPDNKKDVIGRKLTAYLNENQKGKDIPKNNDLVAGIESMAPSSVESFWADDKRLLPELGGNPAWYEVWLIEPETSEALSSSGSANFDELKTSASALGIEVKDQLLKFPGQSVCLVLATREQLEDLITRVGCLGELKRAKEPSDFYFNLPNLDQVEWSRDILKRLNIDENSDVSVCVIDSGANNGHPLLKPLLANADCDTVNPAWGVNDSRRHGTLMCGTSGYGDLVNILSGSFSVDIHHRLESVKILPGNQTEETPPELWGEITQQAISRAEIREPNRKRIGCMAITAQSETEPEPGRPSSWSAAVDKLVAGDREGDAPNRRRRLMFVSAGNVTGSDKYSRYPSSNCLYCVEDPGQSWNAVTVGAYTEKMGFCEGRDDGCQPLARRGELSPFSSTSLMWKEQWPVKPDIVLEGGNVLKDMSGDFLDNHEAALLLTTNYQPSERLFKPFGGTSAAAALAAQMAAELQAKYPLATPETIRGLMIHSARWTPELIAQYKTINRVLPNASLSKSDYARLLRFCGYGVPDFDRASTCANNILTMIAQSTIQPFIKKEPNKDPVINQMAFFHLPWPKEDLLSMGETQVKLRVTLSYFIEPSPGPGDIGFGSRYRYSSFGLRFAVKRDTETEDVFRSRVNGLMRQNNGDVVSYDSGSERWTIGSMGRDRGSIHSDVMDHETAASLASCDMVGVYPIGGWWKERSKFECYNRKVHYSLIVSLETEEENCDIYTPVKNMIQARVPISIPI